MMGEVDFLRKRSQEHEEEIRAQQARNDFLCERARLEMAQDFTRQLLNAPPSFFNFMIRVMA